MLKLRLTLALLLLPALQAHADPPSHGGPIRALAALGDHLVSGGFDGAAILWPDGPALRGPASAVNAVALAPDGAILTGTADGHVRVWRNGAIAVDFCCHAAPIAGLAIQGAVIASAGWDGTLRLWSATGEPHVLTGHTGPVNAAAFLPNGDLVSAGYDGTLRLWHDGAQIRLLRPGPPQNALAPLGHDTFAAGGADGVLRLLGPNDTERHVTIDDTPITALAAAPDGTHLAAATLGGVIMVIDVATARIATVLHGAERPVWALAWWRGTIVSGGASGVPHLWNPTHGTPEGTLGPTPATAPPPTPGDRGARIFRACAVCHSLTAESGNRAGPSLHAIFGRPAGSLPGYPYSQALRDAALTWTPDTIARLFTIGPAAMLPGTTMPDQIVADPEDRAALLDYLARPPR